MKAKTVKPEALDKRLTYKEVAERLNVTVRTVKAMVRDGKLPALRFNPSLVRIRSSDVQAFEDRALTTAPSAMQMEKAGKMIAAAHGGAQMSEARTDIESLGWGLHEL